MKESKLDLLRHIHEKEKEKKGNHALQAWTHLALGVGDSGLD